MNESRDKSSSQKITLAFRIFMALLLYGWALYLLLKPIYREKMDFISVSMGILLGYLPFFYARYTLKKEWDDLLRPRLQVLVLCVAYAGIFFAAVYFGVINGGWSMQGAVLGLVWGFFAVERSWRNLKAAKAERGKSGSRLRTLLSERNWLDAPGIIGLGILLLIPLYYVIEGGINK